MVRRVTMVMMTMDDDGDEEEEDEVDRCNISEQNRFPNQRLGLHP